MNPKAFARRATADPIRPDGGVLVKFIDFKGFREFKELKEFKGSGDFNWFQ